MNISVSIKTESSNFSSVMRIAVTLVSKPFLDLKKAWWVHIVQLDCDSLSGTSELQFSLQK